MKQYTELNQAIEEVLDTTSESEHFKKRLSKLIENAMKDTYRDDDILDLIMLMEEKENKE